MPRTFADLRRLDKALVSFRGTLDVARAAQQSKASLSYLTTQHASRPILSHTPLRSILSRFLCLCPDSVSLVQLLILDLRIEVSHITAT